MFDGKDGTRTERGRVKGQAKSDRRRWSAEDKARIVAEASAPGAVVSAVARRWQLHPQQVHPQQVFGWRRREAACSGLPAPCQPSLEQVMAGPSMPDFVPILTDAAAPMQPAPAASPAPTIEVEIAGAVVSVAPGTSGALLTAVLRAVRASAATAAA